MSTFTNPLKQRLKEADPLFGLWLSLGSDAAAEALAHAGFDWLLIDMEHAPNDSGDVTSQLRAIAAAHLPSEPVVRLPASEAWLVKRVMDAGARTLMFPNIESAEEAAHAVRLTQYPSAEAVDGLRGVAGVVRAAAYGMRRDYVQTANAQIAPSCRSSRRADSTKWKRSRRRRASIACSSALPISRRASAISAIRSMPTCRRPWRASSARPTRRASQPAFFRWTPRAQGSIAIAVFVLSLWPPTSCGCCAQPARRCRR